VLVIDENSKKIIDNVVKEDDILNENIASMCWKNPKFANAKATKISNASRNGGI
jgi:hypothetical protein